MEIEKIEKHNPDTFSIFLKKLNRNYEGLLKYMEKVNINTKSKIYDFNTTNGIEQIKKAKIDIVLTSPPYGDSKTTVAYGQFSRLSNEWLDIDNANQIDNILMGGKTEKVLYETGIKSIDDIVKKIHNIDVKRGGDVLSFLSEYKKSIDNVSTLLVNGAAVCYVVGNRTVKNIDIPMDDITADIFVSNGLIHEETIIRNIPNKRMPSKNSPTNETGVKSKTMNNEYIVILKKPL